MSVRSASISPRQIVEQAANCSTNPQTRPAINSNAERYGEPWEEIYGTVIHFDAVKDAIAPSSSIHRNKKNYTHRVG